jgi:hypothetical protein
LGFCTLTDVWRSFLARFSCRLRLARADGTPVRVRGSVVSLDGSKLIVRAKDGKDVSVSSADNFCCAGRREVVDGGYQRRHVHWRRDSNAPCDQWKSLYSRINCVEPPKATALGTPGSSSMITNATVANAVKGVDGQTVTVTYKGGEKKIDIPANVPVVALVPASKDDIAPGAIVFVPSERQ